MLNPEKNSYWKKGHKERLRVLEKPRLLGIEEDTQAHWPRDRYLFGKRQLTTASSCSPNKSGDGVTGWRPTQKSRKPFGFRWGSLKKYLGIFIPEVEGLLRASGEICARKSRKPCDGDRVLIATSNVYPELGALRGSPWNTSISLWDLNEITKNFHVWGF